MVLLERIPDSVVCWRITKSIACTGGHKSGNEVCNTIDDLLTVVRDHNHYSDYVV